MSGASFLKKNFAVILLLTAGSINVYGQQQNFSELHFSQASSDSLAPQGMYSFAMGGLILLSMEGLLAAGSAATRYPAGSYVMGGFQGIYALALASSAFVESENPYPRLIMAGGLGYLSYYNFRFQGSDSNARKFWTNFVGINATGAAALLAYVALPDRGFNLFASSYGRTNLALIPAPQGAALKLRF